MTNNEKAHQIAWENTKLYDPNWCKQEWVEMGAREMSQWKDKQLNKERAKSARLEILVHDQREALQKLTSKLAKFTYEVEMGTAQPPKSNKIEMAKIAIRMFYCCGMLSLLFSLIIYEFFIK